MVCVCVLWFASAECVSGLRFAFVGLVVILVFGLICVLVVVFWMLFLLVGVYILGRFWVLNLSALGWRCLVVGCSCGCLVLSVDGEFRLWFWCAW